MRVPLDPREARLAATARAQLGCFTVEQAIDAGFDRSTVHRRAQRGAWQWLDEHVLRAAASAPVDWRQRLSAAALSVDGVACRASAAALYELVPAPPVPHVLVARRLRNRTRPGLHSTTSLPATDVVRVGPIRATSPVRTLIDLAGEVDRDVAIDAVDAAIARGLARPERLDRRARELLAPARPGAARVLDILASRHPELEAARNQWEARLLRLAASLALPRPAPNYEVFVGGRRRYLDLAWPDARVFVEFDGYLPHAGRRVFDDDRARQNDLVDLGWVPFRLTSTALTHDAHAALAPVARAIRRRLAVAA